MIGIKTAQEMIGVQSLGEYRSRLEKVAKAHDMRVTTDTRLLQPRIESGRWLVVCPNCGAGIAVEPKWQGVCCLDPDCCRWFPRLEIPEDRDDIEGALSPRQKPNRNWRPGETVEDLRKENARHAIGEREEGTP
jgi:hypothetical protein